jgi:hypothetical protein
LIKFNMARIWVLEVAAKVLWSRFWIPRVSIGVSGLIGIRSTHVEKGKLVRCSKEPVFGSRHRSTCDMLLERRQCRRFIRERLTSHLNSPTRIRGRLPRHRHRSASQGRVPQRLRVHHQVAHVMALHEAGVRFFVNKAGQHLLEVEGHHYRLVIPPNANRKVRTVII